MGKMLGAQALGLWPGPSNLFSLPINSGRRGLLKVIFPILSHKSGWRATEAGLRTFYFCLCRRHDSRQTPMTDDQR